MHKLTKLRVLVLGVWALGGTVNGEATPSNASNAKRILADSFRPIGGGARIVRTSLAADEQAETFDFVVALGLRNVDELRARIAAGSIISNTEMETRYLPLAADYQRVRDWLASEGFTLTDADPGHANVFARGSAARVAQSFQVQLARVATSEGEFTSAITAPSVPEELAPLILDVGGLQRHIRLHRHIAAVRQLSPLTISGHTYLNPASVQAAYAAPTSLDGSGQSIAVLIDAEPANSDLTQFWSVSGSKQTASNVSIVPIGGGPTASGQSDGGDEVCLDTEWAGFMAPKAKLRVYAVPSLVPSNIVKAMTQLITDAGNDASLRVLSCSFGLYENGYSSSSLQSYSQTLARVAAAGITVVVSSGDGGSNPDPSGAEYKSSSPRQVEYPASDPSVLGVGGTQVTFDSTWTQATEVAATPTSGYLYGTGGGVSGLFSRPSWQTGNGVPSGTQRCVPDVAAIFSCAQASPFVISGGAVVSVAGTSLSAPVWAGFAALINQSRANSGQSSAGLLGRWLYPLLGTSAFNDITSGNNGAYSATVGYDLCTGLGTPQMTALISALAAEVSITSSAPSSTVKAGTPVQLVADASSSVTLQWKLNGIAIPGATKATYTLAAAGAADNGAYTLTVTTSAGSVTYDAGTLQTTSDARVINLSARAFVGTGANNLSAGFVVTGPAGATKTMLLRGIGPTLANFSVSDSLAAPVLTFYNSSSVALDSNSTWGGDPTLAAIMASVGAFALPANSHDAVLLEKAAPTTYTAIIAGANGTSGTALAELYDTSYATDGARLVNISARASVAPSGHSLVAGFAVSAGPSGAAETVLIRAVGPTLTSFGVPGVLANPVLTVYDSTGAVIATNTGWGNVPAAGKSTVVAGIDSALPATMSGVGAFSLSAGSADSALVLTLPAGAYTAQVDGVNGSSGVALCEIYEVH